ncbi:MAG: hypothetical protein ABIC40_08710, partial [bacterium]
RISAIRESARVRHEMQEEGLLNLENVRDPGVLVAIDGTLAGIDEAKKLPGLVGLVPATPDILGDNNSVLNLPFKARTAVDMSKDPPMFYMRLRDSSGLNPDFGLVRIEMTNQPDGEPVDEAWASDIASLIMQERFPVKKTIPGWDKRIYALFHAGEYINTLIPPPKVVTTYFGRSTA